MNFIYRLAQKLSFGYLKIFHGIKISGLQNVPKDGPFIVACNHASYIDPPAVGCKIPRNLHYFARSSLFFWPLGLLIKKLNSIPVDRAQLDLSTLRKVLKILKEGNPILVFPEGTRTPNGEIQDAQKGLGLLVHKSGVPVIPARLHGAYDILGKGKIIPRVGRRLYLNFGKQIEFNSKEENSKSKEKYQSISNHVMNEIRKL